jgi:hypothetical protein
MRLLAAALGVVAAVFAGGLVRGFFGNGLPSGTSAFVGGHGVEYTAPDNSYLAHFPKQPVEDQEPVTVGSVTANVTSALVQTDDYEIGTASMQLPIAVPAEQIDGVLDGAMNGGIVQIDGKLQTKNRVTRGGYTAVEATFKASDGYSAHGLVMIHGTRMYMEFVHAKTGTDRLFKALDASFVPVAS